MTGCNRAMQLPLSESISTEGQQVPVTNYLRIIVHPLMLRYNPELQVRPLRKCKARSHTGCIAPGVGLREVGLLFDRNIKQHLINSEKYHFSGSLMF